MKQSPIKSPCIGICQYPNGVCKGCHRTIDEVRDWYDMTDKQKQAVLNRIEKESKGWFK